MVWGGGEGVGNSGISSVREGGRSCVTWATSMGRRRECGRRCGDTVVL